MDLPNFNAPFSPWQTGVVRILRNKKFQTGLLELVSPLTQRGTDPDMLLEALLNYFSMRNNGFVENWWHFEDSDLTLHIDRHGIRFTHPNDDPLADVSTDLVAELIPETDWKLTFLSPHPFT